MARVKKRTRPTKTAHDGTRDSRGCFVKGNPGGPGNVYAKRIHEIRRQLMGAVTSADIKAIAKRLVKDARGGDVVAVRELLNRLVGRSPLYADLELAERVAAIEESLRKEEALR